MYSKNSNVAVMIAPDPRIASAVNVVQYINSITNDIVLISCNMVDDFL